MVGPWACKLMVVGSNPIMVEVFFVYSLLTDRLRDYLKVKFRKALGTAAKAQISNWGQLKKTSSEPTYLYITLFKIILHLICEYSNMTKNVTSS